MILPAMRPAARVAGLLWVLTAGWLAGGCAAAHTGDSAAGDGTSAMTDGVRIGFSLTPATPGETPVAGKDGVFSFTLGLGPDSMPLRGARPAAWLLAREDDKAPDARTCRGLASGVLANTILSTPALDLNAFYILVLSDLPRIAVIDPRNGFGGSRLLGLATLEAPGSDWAISRARDLVAVAEPGANTVALFDAADWSLRSKFAVPHPERLVLTSDERLLLASYHLKSGEDGVAIIDLSRPGAVPLRVPTGNGPSDIATDAPGSFAFVTEAGSDRAWVIDLNAGQVVTSVATGRQPIAVAWSSLARRAYAGAADGSITVFGSGPDDKVTRIEAPAGLTALAVAPGGRFILAVSANPGQLVVIDAATNRIVQRVAVDGYPDAIGFTDSLVWLRRRFDAYLQTMPLDQIGIEGRTPNSLNVGIGQMPLGAAALPARAPSIAPVLGAGELLIANPGERAIYDYHEGMAAPSGNFEAYGGEPRAVEVMDRGLREAAPGTYRTIGRLPRAGHYDAVFFLDQPRIIQCFPLRIEVDPADGLAARPAPRPDDFVLGAEPRAGKALPVKFRLIDTASGAPEPGVRDVRVISYRMPGDNRSQSWAEPRADGFYETEIPVAEAGIYYVFVDAPSVALAPGKARIINVRP